MPAVSTGLLGALPRGFSSCSAPAPTSALPNNFFERGLFERGFFVPSNFGRFARMTFALHGFQFQLQALQLPGRGFGGRAPQIGFAGKLRTHRAGGTRLIGKTRPAVLDAFVEFREYAGGDHTAHTQQQ
jgi:hypothetical protein